MNQFAFIDYQRPIGLQNDYRTSSYRGHLFFNDARLSKKKETKSVSCEAFYSKEAEHEEFNKPKSEQKEHYIQKNVEPDIIRNPPLSSRTVKYMKQYDESHLKGPPKQLSGPQSIYKTDFIQKPQRTAENIPALPSNTPIEISTKICNKVPIERTNAGYAKYLDTVATTSRLDYVPYTTEQQLGIGAKDNITYWTWLKKEGLGPYNVRPVREVMCNGIPGTRFENRRNEFQNQCKPVPNAGLTTESRSNYSRPRNTIEFNSQCTSTTFISCDIAPIQQKTESKIYGSGERLDKFINITAKRT